MSLVGIEYPATYRPRADMPVRRGDIAETLTGQTTPGACTSGAGANAFGAWTAIGSALPNDFYLSNWVAAKEKIELTSGADYVELGYGSAPTTLDIVKWQQPLTDSLGGASGRIGNPTACIPVRIPAGQTLQARARAHVGSSVFDTMYCGWENAVPDFDYIPQWYVDGPGRYLPSNTTTISPISAAMPNFGVGATPLNAALTDLLITGVSSGLSLSALLDIVAFQIGYGPAGNEVWCATALISAGQPSAPIYPPILIKAGERVAVRASENDITMVVKCYDLEQVGR